MWAVGPQISTGWSEPRIPFPDPNPPIVYANKLFYDGHALRRLLFSFLYGNKFIRQPINLDEIWL